MPGCLPWTLTTSLQGMQMALKNFTLGQPIRSICLQQQAVQGHLHTISRACPHKGCIESSSCQTWLFRAHLLQHGLCLDSLQRRQVP